MQVQVINIGLEL